MKIAARYALAVLLALVMTATTALAKGPVDKITLSGPGLSQPVEITEGQALSDFSPWAARFIDWDRDGPAAFQPGNQPYEATFYLRDEGGSLRPIYVLQYDRDPASGQGFIYLPGRGEPGYARNIGTIIQTGADGRWRYASTEWDAAMARVLAEAVAPATARPAFLAAPPAAPVTLPVTGGAHALAEALALASGAGLLLTGWLWRPSRRGKHRA